MKKQPKTYVFYIGIGLWAVGTLLKYLVPEVSSVINTVAYMSGFGVGLIGVGVLGIILKRWRENNPQKAKQYEIEEKDERNIRLREKAGLASWYTTLLVMFLLTVTFIVLDNNVAAGLTIGALFIHTSSIMVWVFIYNKKM